MTEDPVSHTPGPWEVGDGLTNGHSLMVYCNDPLGSRVADCSNSGHGLTDAQDRANARLIAAAPDLLEVVKRCVEAFGTFQATFGKLNQPALVVACAGVEAACKLVVAKAEGRS